jgi:hypothetical protein
MKLSRPARVRAALPALPLGVPDVGGGAGANQPGAYCPLPKKGETPPCLEPAIAEYSEFFSAIEEEDMSETRLARLEGDVAAGAKAENAYLALSSLAYGYYRLSQRVATAEGADPRFLARLEQWNALLAVAYEASAEDTDFRRAVREAALDLQRNAPPVRMRCVDERGEATECDSTDAVMRGIDAAANEVGIRGALERLLKRIFGLRGS